MKTNKIVATPRSYFHQSKSLRSSGQHESQEQMHARLLRESVRIGSSKRCGRPRKNPQPVTGKIHRFLVKKHLKLNALTWNYFISVVKERFENIFDLEEEEDTRTGRVQVIQTSITSSCSSSKSIQKNFHVKYDDEHQENDTLGAQADKLEQLRKKVTTFVPISCQAIQTSDH